MAPPLSSDGDVPVPPSFDSVPPPPPPPSFSAPSAGGRDALLDSIKAGGRLRKVDPSASPSAAPSTASSDGGGGGRGGLLGEIKNRSFQLRSVDKAALVEEKKPIPPSSGLSSIMDVLARRTAIVGNDSDSDDNDEWDED